MFKPVDDPNYRLETMMKNLQRDYDKPREDVVTKRHALKNFTENSQKIFEPRDVFKPSSTGKRGIELDISGPLDTYI
ncbi:MAG: hypothetical protein ACLFQV_04485 [Vulcanimicrobiota bacterium]